MKQVAGFVILLCVVAFFVFLFCTSNYTAALHFGLASKFDYSFHWGEQPYKYFPLVTTSFVAFVSSLFLAIGFVLSVLGAIVGGICLIVDDSEKPETSKTKEESA